MRDCQFLTVPESHVEERDTDIIRLEREPDGGFRLQDRVMKKIKSIFIIFGFFLIMIIASFLILYRYSAASLRDSLMRVAQIQMEYARALLEQKINEIEIEADGILNSNDFKELQLMVMDDYDPYEYVMGVKNIKEYLNRRQKSNVGMSEFILYWPEQELIISTLNKSDVDQKILDRAEDNKWFYWEKEVYFVRRYTADWLTPKDEPYLFIRMERDYLYKIKNMASGMGTGGTLLVLPDRQSLFSADRCEQILLSELVGKQDKKAFELSVNREKYQVIQSGAVRNGLSILAYYPMDEMRKPIMDMMGITARLLGLILTIGFIFMVLYYKNILLQLKIITEKLRQVEGGDFTSEIEVLPDNEFSYVFEQFNKMVSRIRDLVLSTIKEQQLRTQAELRQLQLQIHPHFLYNSLSYIVTVADKPEAVTEMAVHLAGYYRYCTKKKTIATIGEEISYAKAYLSIMAMRKCIMYNINVSEALYDTPIIPLVLQPIIENAVEHAIEEREHAKYIFVKIYKLPDGSVRFEISDDGDGMTEKEIEKLLDKLKKKNRDEEESVGLWNVNQRLVNYYDASSGLRFGRSIWGGLLVSFTIVPKRAENEAVDCG